MSQAVKFRNEPVKVRLIEIDLRLSSESRTSPNYVHVRSKTQLKLQFALSASTISAELLGISQVGHLSLILSYLSGGFGHLAPLMTGTERALFVMSYLSTAQEPLK